MKLTDKSGHLRGGALDRVGALNLDSMLQQQLAHVHLSGLGSIL
jgi:hypothetical protein